MSDRVLLTGISGFLGGHIALALLKAGFTIRGSTRNAAKADQVRSTLAKAGGDVSQIAFATLDLTSDAGWAEAAQGCRYLMHTASPFVISMPKDKMDLIRPAVEGTERALRAGLKAGVERIVLTSSFAAIGYGHDKARTAPFTAKDWTNLEGRSMNAYTESKTRAEQRAWEVMKEAGREKDLATINPTLILGPLLDEDPGTSALVVKRLLNGSFPALPRLNFIVVDVRDVADAHVAALTKPDAGGRRFPLGEGPVSFKEIADMLRTRFPDHSAKIPSRKLPDWAMRIFALVDRDVRGNLGELGVVKRLDSSDGIALLGHKMIAPERALIATAESLVAQKIV